MILDRRLAGLLLATAVAGCERTAGHEEMLPTCLPRDPHAFDSNGGYMFCGIEDPAQRYPQKGGLTPRVVVACTPAGENGCEALACSRDDVDRLVEDEVLEQCGPDSSPEGITSVCFDGPEEPAQMPGMCCFRGLVYGDGC